MRVGAACQGAHSDEKVHQSTQEKPRKSVSISKICPSGTCFLSSLHLAVISKHLQHEAQYLVQCLELIERMACG